MFKKTIKIIFGIIFIPGITALAIAFTPLGDKPLAMFLPVENVEETDFKTLRLKSSPNQYLLCPVNTCSAPTNGVSPIFNIPVSQLKIYWDQMIARQPQITHRSDTTDNDQLELVQRTKIMRYPDVITVRFFPIDKTRSTLAIYSRSLYGQSDFGANNARVESWIAELRDLADT